MSSKDIVDENSDLSPSAPHEGGSQTAKSDIDSSYDSLLFSTLLNLRIKR